MNQLGTGLGLFNSCNIATKIGLNKKLTISSKINQGSKFLFKVYKNFNLKFEYSNKIDDRKNDINETEENKVLI